MKRLLSFLSLVALCLTTSVSVVSAQSADEKYPSKKGLQGEWTYSGLTFQNRGGGDFANMVVATLQMQSAQIEQLAGVKAGDIVLNLDGKQAIATMKESKATCDYEYAPKSGVITVSGTANGKAWSLEGIIIAQGNDIHIYCDVNKLIACAKQVNPEITTDQKVATLINMLSSQQGIYIGAKFKR